MVFSEDAELQRALGLDDSAFEYKQVTGFGDYLAFSDLQYPATMGRVVVLHQGTVVEKIIGDPGASIGEYLFIGEDSPGGNIVVGVSSRSYFDAYDHIDLYKVLPQSDGTLGWFKYFTDAVITEIQPAKGTVDEILFARGTPLSISFAYGTILTTHSRVTSQTRICSATEKYDNGACTACPNMSGTVDFQ